MAPSTSIRQRDVGGPAATSASKRLYTAKARGRINQSREKKKRKERERLKRKSDTKREGSICEQGMARDCASY
jgi:hypothetical protein